MVRSGKPCILNSLEEVERDCLDSCAELCVSAALVVSAEASNETSLDSLLSGVATQQMSCLLQRF